MKQLLADGAIGTVTSVHFEWLLDTAHGVDYFRRWHREKTSSGGPLVHKSTHHFDLVNWWLADTAASVYVMGGLKFYGERNTRQRGIAPRPRLGGDLPSGDPFRIDLAADPALRALYLDAEALDGYHRDVDVFADGITIEDSLSLVVGYQRGATMTYSLSAFSPWEGYRVAINETGSRIELEVVERSWVPSAAFGEEKARVIDPSAGHNARSGPDGSRPAGERVTPPAPLGARRSDTHPSRRAGARGAEAICCCVTYSAAQPTTTSGAPRAIRTECAASWSESPPTAAWRRADRCSSRSSGSTDSTRPPDRCRIKPAPGARFMPGGPGRAVAEAAIPWRPAVTGRGRGRRFPPGRE